MPMRLVVAFQMERRRMMRCPADVSRLGIVLIQVIRTW